MRAERGDREGEGTLVVEIRERELGWQVGPLTHHTDLGHVAVVTGHDISTC